ncbi:cache domain-containing protein [Marinitoga sp. 38H-ov]|uniref:cache domain-containing protein n=1 Tax=Marinitoga sp. 38H-ov TaxID=1755814 RepID=UPI0013EA0F09|nr:cache domain-containing protein [Marinitoga sp. 38H-ov]KAF2956588.1 hypothetical protein AS160_05165 [Marinitoga sp. 38H-ov]
MKKNKLLNYALIISFIFVIYISVNSIIYYYNTNLTKSQDYIKSENSVIATFINDYFTELINIAETFSKDSDFLNAYISKESEKKVLEILKNYRESNENIEFIYPGYKNKKIIIDNWEVPEEYDPTIRPWYLEGIKNPNSVYIGTPYREYTSKQWLISTGKALIKDGEVIGVLSIDCSIKDFVNLINDEINYKTGQSFVINKEGIVILHKNLDYINKKFFNDLSILKKNNGITKFKYNDKDYYIAYTKLPSTGWYVITMVEKWEINSPVIKGAISNSIILLILLIAFLHIQSIVYTNLNLKKVIEERNIELEIKNKKIMDSLYYAKHIQDSILPSDKLLKRKLKDFFVYWKPANIVGGDFYWFKELDDGSYYISVIDCTGHGVPGALMTMTVNSLLNRITDNKDIRKPSEILKELNILFKKTLNSKIEDYRVDDGLEIGICYINKNKLIYSGAGISLYFTNKNYEITRIKGNVQGIGYKRSKIDYDYIDHIIELEEDMSFYLATDGYEDQNNTENKRFGRKNFLKIISNVHNKPMDIQKKIFKEKIEQYMSGEEQRDDITVLGFKI